MNRPGAGTIWKCAPIHAERAGGVTARPVPPTPRAVTSSTSGNGDGPPTAHISDASTGLTLCGLKTRRIDPPGAFIRCETCRTLWILDDSYWNDDAA